MSTITLQVSGMSCGHCVNSVEKALYQLGAKGKVNLTEGSVFVEYEASSISVEAIKAAIEDQGYEVE